MPEEVAVRRDQKVEIAQEKPATKKSKPNTSSVKIPEGKDLTDDWVEDADGNFLKPEDLAKKED